MLVFTFWFFVGIAFVQLCYYTGVFGRFSFLKLPLSTPKRVGVSIVVCAKNEEENVREFVPMLLAQDYPDFEVVLIDDASSDHTRDVFEAFERSNPNVKLVKVENNEAFWGNKKFALTLGIKAARKEYLLFTDADCKPSSVHWLREMSSQFTLKRNMVLGYGAYDKIKGSFLNKIIRFETLMTALQYFSWAKIGKPYMGVGRNLAYKKELFFSVRGFMDHMKIRSGDDDLFVNQAATSSNTTVCFHPDAFTYSRPKTTYKEWFRQKRRHVSTARHYKMFDRMQLGLFYVSQILFFVLAAVLLAFQFRWEFVAGIVVFRYLFAWTIVGLAAAKLKEKDVIYLFPLLEGILIFTQLNIFISNLFSKPVHWK